MMWKGYKVSLIVLSGAKPRKALYWICHNYYGVT